MHYHTSFDVPALAALKAWLPADEDTFARLVYQSLAEKGVAAHTMQFLASLPVSFFQGWLHHLTGWGRTEADAHRLQQRLAALASAPSASQSALSTIPYDGTRPLNRQIDTAIFSSEEYRLEGMRPFTWRGAAGAYWSASLNVRGTALAHTRIIILGAGAAGILLAHALQQTGFTNVLHLERDGCYGGIWRQEALRQATRANPFALTIEQEHVLPAAPGAGSDVLTFLDGFAKRLPPLQQATCHGIIPGDLSHRVYYRDAKGEHEILAPIVVNALGVGEPLHPHRPGKMQTNVSPEQAGRRWQHPLTEEEVRQFHGKRLVFVGLSNATFAMLAQIQRWNKLGAAIDYRVITHYPEASLANPTQQIEHNGTSYHFYRNLERFHLLRVAGDIPEVAEAFHQAREGGHILSHVTAWRREGEDIAAICEDGSQHILPCDCLYTLIGYGPRASLLDEMGLLINNRYLGAVNMDYDGEAHRPDAASSFGRARVSPGYFCFGIRNSFNPNEVLLNGLLFRLPQILAGIVLRAAEVASLPHRGTGMKTGVSTARSTSIGTRLDTSFEKQEGRR